MKLSRNIERFVFRKSHKMCVFDIKIIQIVDIHKS